MAKANEIKYLTAIKSDKRIKKFCRFKKYGIRYIDYKDVEFLKKFLNEQGKLLPRRLSAIRRDQHVHPTGQRRLQTLLIPIAGVRRHQPGNCCMAIADRPPPIAPSKRLTY